MTQLAREFAQRPDVRYGLTTMCVGLGMGGAVIWENPNFTVHCCCGRRQMSTGIVSAHRPGRPPDTGKPRANRPAVEEVVTTSHLRLLAVPGIPGQVALITLDNGLDHTRPSTFGPAGLASLNEAIDAAIAAAPAAIAVTGKPFVFAVGADLSQIGTIVDRETARQTGVLGQSTFAKLRRTRRSRPSRSSTAPRSAAASNLRWPATTEPWPSNAAMMALPEVFLGILPGWGGTQLLPKIVGPENAVTVIIENSLNQNHMMRPKEAAKLGVVDIVIDAADYLEESFRWMAGVLDGRVTLSRKDYSGAEFDAEWLSALERGRVIADMRTHGASPAPYRALELIELSRTVDLATGLAAEAEGLADLIVSQQFRAGLYSFNLTQKRARKPAGAPGCRAGPQGHQGRRDRRRTDGRADRHAVRPATPRPGRAHRRRPGPARQGPGRRAPQDLRPGGQGQDDQGRGQPADRSGHRIA